GSNFFGIMKCCRCDCSSAGCCFCERRTKHKIGGGDQNRGPEPHHSFSKEHHSRGDQPGLFHLHLLSGLTNAERKDRKMPGEAKVAAAPPQPGVGERLRVSSTSSPSASACVVPYATHA